MATAPTELVSDTQYHQFVPLRTLSFPSPVPLMCPPIPRARKKTHGPASSHLLQPLRPHCLPQRDFPPLLLPSWKVTTPAPMCSLISRSVSCVTDLLSALSHVLSSSSGSLVHLGPGLPPPRLVPRSHMSASEVSGLPSPTPAVKRSTIQAKQEMRTCDAQPWVQTSDPFTHPRCRDLSKPLLKTSLCLHVGLPCR